MSAEIAAQPELRARKRVNDPEGMRKKVLDIAEESFQARGYHASSLGDLMAAAGVSGGALHHHFPTKETLGITLIDSNLERFTAELDALSAKRTDAKSKLLTYGDFFAESLHDGLMPLCGALAADVAYLPTSMQQRVKKFFEIHTDWLETILRDGITHRELQLSSPPRKSALLLLSTLQGASVVAWALKDPTIIKPAFRQALDNLIK